MLNKTVKLHHAVLELVRERGLGNGKVEFIFEFREFGVDSGFGLGMAFEGFGDLEIVGGLI